MTSDEKDFQEECNTLTNMFLERGYPMSFIENLRRSRVGKMNLALALEDSNDSKDYNEGLVYKSSSDNPPLHPDLQVFGAACTSDLYDLSVNNRVPKNDNLTQSECKVLDELVHNSGLHIMKPDKGVPNGNATITYSKKGDNNLNVSCSWSGGVPPAKVLLELDNISKNGTEEVNTEVGQGRVSCVGQHLFLKSETALLLEKPKPETNISNPSEIIATDEQEVTLLVTLSSGGKMLERAQSGNKEILPATFKWFHPNEGEIPGNGNDKYRISSTTQQSVFVISEFAGEKDRGLYRCTVTNILGSVNFTFQINIKPGNSCITTLFACD
ncbi:uncharacterized protein LOC122808422 [Protopterus annectens]|uniref:uncharacterized protein LOC122808422 n=1 Tax=Protopterus annectens TaxID=7888 RepID=UPI001CFA7B24|nr:uncharacterized protein LOC122808422 [Protopterus annectens]